MGRDFGADLSAVVQSGVQTLLWAGDADWICNWFGNQAVAEAVTYSGSSTFKTKALAPYNVNGVQKGTFKNVNNFTQVLGKHIPPGNIRYRVHIFVLVGELDIHATEKRISENPIQARSNQNHSHLL